MPHLLQYMFSVYIYLYAKIYSIITSYIGLYVQRNLISNIFQQKIRGLSTVNFFSCPGYGAGAKQGSQQYPVTVVNKHMKNSRVCRCTYSRVPY